MDVIAGSLLKAGRQMEPKRESKSININGQISGKTESKYQRLSNGQEDRKHQKQA